MAARSGLAVPGSGMRLCRTWPPRRSTSGTRTLMSGTGPLAPAGTPNSPSYEHERAQIAVLISLHEPTRAMRVEAADAGFYITGWNESYPRLQLLTVADLLAGRGVAYPAWSANSTFKSAPRAQVQG